MYIGYTGTLPHTSPMSAPVGQNTNQLSENIYCNSEAYNVIYDANYIMSTLTTLKPSIDTLLNNNITFFSNKLSAPVGIPALGYEINDHPEMNRRNLKVSSALIRRHRNLIVYTIYSTYDFSLYDTSNTFTLNTGYSINGNNCEYIQNLGKGWHKFQRKPIEFFHFSFHGVNSISPREKSVGAFHVKFDWIDRCMFRPFIIHPVRTGYQFYRFHDFSKYLINYYTTVRSVPAVNEFTAYMTRNPHKNEPGMISNIVIPIYDTLIVQLLNPLAQLNLPAGTVIPYPIRDTNHGVIKTCADMIANPGTKPKWFGGKKTRKQTRSRPRKQRKRTLKRIW